MVQKPIRSKGSFKQGAGRCRNTIGNCISSKGGFFCFSAVDLCRIQSGWWCGGSVNKPLGSQQYEHIGKFIGLWATFQNLWQRLIYPNLLHSQAILEKVSKSFFFLVKSFLGNFYRHLATFYQSHWQPAMFQRQFTTILTPPPLIEDKNIFTVENRQGSN